jgi:hypothetical protein
LGQENAKESRSLRALIEVDSETGVVTVADAGEPLPSGLDQKALLEHLEPLARSSRVFFLVDDDPIGFRVELFADEAVPSSFAGEFEPAGGAFRLESHGGRVVVCGWDETGQPGEAGGLTLAPGTYLVSVLKGRPFDGARHAKEMGERLGAEWKFKQTVDNLGSLGCLPIVATAIVLLMQRWHWLWYALPAIAVSFMPYVVLKRSHRYRAVGERASEFARAQPHYVVTLTKTQGDGVAGGFLRL